MGTSSTKYDSENTFNQKHCDETKQRVQWQSEARTQENHKKSHDGPIKPRISRNVTMFVYFLHEPMWSSVQKGTLANNVDQDQTPRHAASDQSLQCLH